VRIIQWYKPQKNLSKKFGWEAAVGRQDGCVNAYELGKLFPLVVDLLRGIANVAPIAELFPVFQAGEDRLGTCDGLFDSVHLLLCRRVVGVE
jgi:hypothetical protein